MKHKIYSIFDEKAQIFNTPFFMDNDNMAVRAFNDLASDKQSAIYLHPEDYRLYELGSFENVEGVIIPVDRPRFICNAQLNLKLGDTDAPPDPSSTT